ncbi:unnamed protein product [Candida verbasci]|uniref:Transmembrane protein n=1 Tax=Candida verbasci TaxID=1227364 RepID=A0A9W4TV76_9ASCO|nr:unnamed protein product [Candida verbasci]
MFTRLRLSKQSNILRRFQSTTTKVETAGFNNKYNFNLNPPPVHEYWNFYNSSVLFMFIPLFLSVGYLTKYMVTNLDYNFTAFRQFSENDKSPLREITFGEQQQKKE